MDDSIKETMTNAELWAELTPTQRRFVVAMTEYPNKKESAEAIGIAPQTAYNWNGNVNDAIDFVRENIALATLGVLTANAAKAAMVKSAGLDSNDERIAQAAATEIIDRILGKSIQRSEIAGKDGAPIFNLSWGDNADG